MKTLHPSIIGLFLVGLITACQDPANSPLDRFSPPSSSEAARPLAPGLISTEDYEFAITMNPAMDEVFFTRRKPQSDNQIYRMRWTGDHWTDPEPVSFSASSGWDFEPHIEPRGQRLYFGSTRPLPSTDAQAQEDQPRKTTLRQWYLEKKDFGWTQAQVLEDPFKSLPLTMYLTASLNGNLYFNSGKEGEAPADWKLYRAKKEGGSYPRIQLLPAALNDIGTFVAHPFIDPQEEFLIFDARQAGNYGASDLYISFQVKGQWTPAQNLGAQINSSQNEMCASLSPDGQYLFFHRGEGEKGDIYWIAFQPILESLKTKSLS